MYYYEVFVAEPRYQKLEPLTYASEMDLSVGSIVLVPYGKKTTSGFIAKQVPRPEFVAKPIVKQLAPTPLPKEALTLHKWILEYYPGSSGAITQLFIPSGLDIKSRTTKLDKKSIANPELPPLTHEQARVLHEIASSEYYSFLLYGETGSGKTRVYQELTRQTLEAGQSAIILTPEISLVPQLQESFRQMFDEQVVVLHSGLTKASRLKNWLKILQSSEPLVVIGTRSALFAPLKNIGFIAVDEMHEPAYKQESSPRYQALRAAAQTAKIHRAKIVYGSATPPIVEYFIAESTKFPILRMTGSAKSAGEVTKTVVDLKDKKDFSRHPYLSDRLLRAIEKRLQDSEQSLLFLNRRGTARQILCQNCGWQAMCPRCDAPLTYHGDDHTMRCHTCGHRSKPPYACPTCGSDNIVYRSLGTKALVDALQSFFPNAKIARFDTDNTAEEQLARKFETVKEGGVDILVGTQMLGKGLDLPKLSLVGIINADTGLGMPDFSSAERSYQLLHQALGRVGRGHLRGEVIIQSFNPESPLIKNAVNQDWYSLYRREIEERKQFMFPPFCFLLKITVSRRTSAAAEKFAYKLHGELKSFGLKLQIHTPTPCFYEKSHGKYNWQIVIKARDRKELIKAVLRLTPGDYTYDLDPSNLL